MSTNAVASSPPSRVMAMQMTDRHGLAFFSGTSLNSSATISAFPEDDGVTIIGFYGQALGAFGAGQNLRSELATE